MRSYTYDTQGNEVTTYFYPKDCVVFEIASFFLHIPSTECIQAITACSGYLASFDSINMLFRATIPLAFHTPAKIAQGVDNFDALSFAKGIYFVA